MEYDVKTSWDRKSGYVPTYLSIARLVIFAGFSIMALVGVVTILTVQKTANIDYSIAHSFKPVH